MESQERIPAGELAQRIKGLTQDENDPIATMANVAAELHHGRFYFWTGWYRVVNGELLLGPFQGPTACTRIQKGKGVCGTAWERDETVVVPDVDEFPGHIACDPRSRSEIVIPIHDEKGEVVGVLDIDSDRKGSFDEDEQRFLEGVVDALQPFALH
jgi:GAF domain-containing protein